MYFFKLDWSPSVESAAQKLSAQVHYWAIQTDKALADAEPSDSWNQANIVGGWLPWLNPVDHPELLESVRRHAISIDQHLHRIGIWKHGYWMNNDIRRGTSHFLRFLQPLARLCAEDNVLKTRFLDATEHLLGPVGPCPGWFDFKSRLFASSRLGTERVDTENGLDINFPTHFRLIHLALTAFSLSVNRPYLEMAEMAALPWAEALSVGKAIPLALSTSGPLMQLNRRQEEILRMLDYDPLVEDTPLERAELYFVSGAVDVFLKLYLHKPNPLFKKAAEVLLDHLAPEIYEADAGAVSVALRKYQETTGDRRYEKLLVTLVSQLNPRSITVLGLKTGRLLERRPAGACKRKDAPEWLEDGHERIHSPLTLASVALLCKDPSLAALSLDLCRAYLVLGMRGLPTGQADPGCAATLNAVVRGHDRENFSGIITEALMPITHCFCH